VCIYSIDSVNNDQNLNTLLLVFN